jgi:hypothetical protein
MPKFQPHFSEAGATVIVLTAQILKAHVDAFHDGRFAGEHEEIGEIEDLIDQAAKFQEERFVDLDACKVWLHKVADFVPILWD